MFRYMGVMWDARSTLQTATVELLSHRLKALSEQWREVFSHDGMRIFCADPGARSLQPHILADNTGVVLGTLLKRISSEGAIASPPVIGAREAVQIRDSRGKWLIENCWGDYVAFIDRPHAGTKCVVKDPTGSLPCYRTDFRGASIFFSSVADCVDLRLMRFTANRSYLLGHLVDAGVSHSHSPLLEVAELRRGECVELDHTKDLPLLCLRCHWTPFSFPEADNLIENPDRAAAALRGAVRSSIHALAGCHDNLILRLSGGLDSSIVSGCLKDAPTAPKVTCHTYFDPLGRSDPRPWARLAAQHASFEHVECPTIPSNLRLADALNMPLSVEPARLLSFMERMNERPMAADRAATAILNGDGGDSGFCSIGIAHALAEFLRLHGPHPSMFRMASQIALLTGRSTWSEIARALRGSRVGEKAAIPKSIYLQASRLVSRQVLESFTPEVRTEHPWFAGKRIIPSGTMTRLGMLIVPSDFYNARSTPDEAAPEIVAPLYSQPVMEVLLRIPIHVHFEGGRDRGLARRAFAGQVPQPILQRHWKDRAPGFHDELIHLNLDFLREFFLDGVLVRERLLDKVSVENALAKCPTKSAVIAGELLGHMGTEMWARHWKSLAHQHEAA